MIVVDDDGNDDDDESTTRLTTSIAKANVGIFISMAELTFSFIFSLLTNFNEIRVKLMKRNNNNKNYIENTTTTTTCIYIIEFTKQI